MLIGLQGIPFVTWKSIAVIFYLNRCFVVVHRRARNVPVNKMSAFYEPYLRLLGHFFSENLCLD